MIAWNITQVVILHTIQLIFHVTISYGIDVWICFENIIPQQGLTNVRAF